MAASSIGPLPSSCKIHAIEGEWVNIDGCSESMKGIAYHEVGLGSFSLCDSPQSWGWKAQQPSTLCRFVHRSSKDLKKSLMGGRRIVFIGDSITRETFFSVAGLMGYEGPFTPYPIEKHADIQVEVGQAKLHFYWAPYIADLKATLAGDIGSPIDLIVAGGGLWDCLHKYNEFDTTGGYKDTIVDVVALFEDYKSKMNTGLVWLVPTTINDVNLPSEEKENQMTEKQVVVYRDYQNSAFASSPSWDLVFDMSLISAPKVSESFDGVHYPKQIYDVSAQILVQTFDWALPKRELEPQRFVPLEPGTMANPALGFLMLCLSLLGLFAFDGYLGFVWIPSLLVGGPDCRELWEEAFSDLHKKIGVVSLEPTKIELANKEECDSLLA